MLNPQLTNIVTASLRAAGITPPELTPIRPFPKPNASIEELTEVLLSSEHTDPYEDPKVIAHTTKLYIQSLSHLDQGHHQRERVRQAAELEAHTDTLLEQIQEAFNTRAQALAQDAEPLKRVEDLTSIDAANSTRDTADAAVSVLQGIAALERIIKAWTDLWAALGNKSYGVDRGKPYMFMNPNAEQWEDLRRNPTIWEAVRRGVPLTLADRPEHVSERYQTMINNEQAAVEALRESRRANYLPEGGYPQYVNR